MATILVVDDEPKMTSLICGTLEDAGHTVHTAVKPEEALALIDKHSFDVVITDLAMPSISGMIILEKALSKEGTDVIMMTAHGTAETAVKALKAGAADYLLKPFALDELEVLVNRLVEKQKLASLSEHYTEEVKKPYARKEPTESGTAFIGNSLPAKRVKEMLARVAPTEATVLITGKSGTGKEVAARMIHDLSPRAKQPFIAVNCAAITETLLESELFGHEKGAFTGAVARKRGRFELAEKGTIFLDEIGEMSPAMQSKLLRVLEERKLVRVGGVDLINVDVRVIAATNKDLKSGILDKSFREDLYFRINVFPIEMPSLADRADDLADLSSYFLSRIGYPKPTLAPEVLQLLMRYDWPGNIRELRNVLERAVILANGESLTAEDFSLDMDDAPLASAGEKLPPQGLEMAEREMILEAIKKSDGNKTEAAKLLGITRRRLYSRMKVHGIPV